MAKAVTGGKGATRKPSERDVLGARRALALAEETISSLAARQAAVTSGEEGGSAVDKLARKEALKSAALRAAARRATGPGTAGAAGTGKTPAKPVGRQAPTRKKR